MTNPTPDEPEQSGPAEQSSPPPRDPMSPPPPMPAPPPFSVPPTGTPAPPSPPASSGSTEPAGTPPAPPVNPYAPASPQPPAAMPPVPGVTPPPPAGQYNYGFQPSSGKNGMAIGSMATGIASIPLACCCGFFGLIPGAVALVLGIISLQQINARGQENRAMAIAGIATGGVAVLLGMASIILGLTGAIDMNWLNNY